MLRYYRRNTINLTSVILGIFILFGVAVAVPQIHDNVLYNYSLVLSAFFVVIPFVNMAFQNFMVKRVYDPDKYFFTLAFDESILYEGLVCGSAIVLLFFIPSTDLRALGFLTAATGVAFWSAVAALTTWVSLKATKINFMSDTILIQGFNFFKSAGLTQKTTTGLGVYTYDEFESYRLSDGGMALLLRDGKGQVCVKLPKEKTLPITQFLNAKGISPKVK